MNEELSDHDATNLIKRIVAGGTVSFSTHGLRRCKQRKITTVDCVAVLRAGWVSEKEERNGSWRYSVCTQKFKVVVAFRSEDELVVVTAWRLL